MLRIFRNVPNVEHQIDKWKRGEIRVLFVVGLSGSGKSTVAKKLAEENGATVRPLDQYLKKLMRKQLGLETMDYESEGKKHGVRLLLEDNPEGRIVFDGAQTAWLNPEELKEYAILFIGKSYVVSTWRAIVRDFTKEHWDKWKTIAPQIHIGYNTRTFKKMQAFYKAVSL